MDTPFFILAGWLIDGSGGPIRDKVVLKIADGRIASIDSCDRSDVPPSFPVVDFSHCTLLPPLVDSHVHLFMSATTSRKLREKQLVDGFLELRPTIARHLHDHFSHGVLAMRDGGDKGGYALAFRQSPEMHPGLILKTVGRAWHAAGRYGGLIGRSSNEGESLARSFSAEEQVADQVKIVNSGFNSLKVFGHETAPQFSGGELVELVAAATKAGKKVMVHANGREPVRLAVEAGAHSIEHGFFMGRDNLERMAERGTFWVPTVFTMKAFVRNFSHLGPTADRRVIERNLEHQLEQLALARQLGVTIAMGTDAGSLGVLHGESMVEEMKLFQKAGYSLAEIIRCATSNGARLLDIDDFGLLAKGWPATFLVTRGVPALLPRKLSYLEAMYIKGQPSPLYRKNPLKHTTIDS